MSAALWNALPWALPVLAALAIVLAGLLQYRLAALVAPEWRVAALLATIGLGALLSVVLTRRSLNETLPGDSGVVLYADFADGFAASRWLSLSLIGAACVEIVRGALRARQTLAADPAWPLFVSLLAFYLGTVGVQAFFSEHVGFAHRELYLPIVLLAVYCQPVRDLKPILGAAKAIVLALLLGSLLAMVVKPDFALQRPHAGAIPGVDWRLFGLTTHANTLGPMALVGVLLELYAPSRRPWWRLLSFGAALTVLLLAQSRTAWAAALAIAALVLVPLAVAPGRGLAAGASTFPRAVWTVVACIAVSIAMTCGAAAFGGSELVRSKTDLGTLNGRFQIWDITLEAWRQNALFGYGPEVWGIARRVHFNLFHVGHAHNQLMQSLGEAGLVGAALLLGYLLALLYAAGRSFLRSRGFVLALLLLLLARCVTEAPMRSEGVLSWSMFLHALLLVLACHGLREQPSPALGDAGSASAEPASAGDGSPGFAGFSTNAGRGPA